MFFGSRRHARESVVVIAGNSIGGTRSECNGDAGNDWRLGRQQPTLNVTRDFKITLHHYAVGDFENQHQQQHQAAPELKIRGHNLNVVFSFEMHAAGRQNQQYHANQQQHAPRWSELLQNRPHERFGPLHEGSAPGLTRAVVNVEITLVKLVSNLGVMLKLRPQFAQFHPRCHTLPEAVNLVWQAGAATLLWAARRSARLLPAARCIGPTCLLGRHLREAEL